MSTASAFAAAAAGWQNFYLLVGTSAATLVGLMFVAVTFGATRIERVERPEVMRAFLDPTLSHFVQVLVTACLLLVPTMTPLVFGALLLAMAGFRLGSLARVHRHMREAQRVNGDLDLSDWISGVILPLGEQLGFAAGGALFCVGRPAFGTLAVATILVLLNGVYGAWETIVWVALSRTGPK